MASSSRKWQFTDDEIREKLKELGYNNIPNEALREFSNDLHELIFSESATDFTPPVNGEQEDSISNSILMSDTSDSTSTESSITYPSQTPESKRIDESVTQKRKGYNPKYYVKENTYNKENGNFAQIKRKVLRKRNGETHVFDESFSQENATDVSDLEKRLQQLPLKDNYENSDDDTMSERSSVLQPWRQNRHSLPSFIRPKQDVLNSKNNRKTDPVRRYHQFKEEWSSNKVPGEKLHKNLRWSTREQMLRYEPVEKPRHSHAPNNYVAPTQKKRQALR
ncbi:hydrolethalus syndrome protein 1-like [Xenia sp. Carnegie-2017]|uniref:hydrolethalus syndrome protein 1-like n=1 Tax=Xenia sp. Carnegie-2017 TaxID=2897299 RepID=UPI001F045833|nr:hydrolethalus syndrome protein 1-like [Xenia sp. Carnegie-2017]